MEVLKRIYHLIVSESIRRLRWDFKATKSCKKIIAFYEKPENLLKYGEDEIKEILRIKDILRKGGLYFFPTIDEKVKTSYMQRTFEIIKDPINSLHYLEFNGKRMYFKRGMEKQQITMCFNAVSLEQHFSSPHRYFTNDKYFIGVSDFNTTKSPYIEKPFGVNEGDVVLDVGGAEGNFALSVVDIASKIYIFECDPKWCEALKATFAPYGSKVQIINKCISNKDDITNMKIDTFFKSIDETINFIKLDIEGFEEDALLGALEVMNSSKDIRLAVCVYHKPQDEGRISEMLARLGFDVNFSEGYMCCEMNGHPCIRRGVLRATKNIKAI